MSAELGAMLVKAGKITQDQLDKALALAQEKKGTLEQCLVGIGAVTSEDEITGFVGKQLNMGTLRLSDVELNPEIVKLIPLDIARKFNVIAVSKLGKNLIVAISDPNNIYVLDAIKFITGCSIQPVISPEKAITKAIDSYYADENAFSQIAKGLEDDIDLEVVETEQAPSEDDLQSAIQDKPLVKLVDSIVADAIRSGASDIHFETYEKRIRVRFRIDGELREMAPLPFKYRAAIVSRLKVMADLDISERRLPQDGRIKIKINERTVDLRVSVLPTIFGEKVVLRILDPMALMVDMTKLGFSEDSLKIFQKNMVMMTGMMSIIRC